MRLFIFIFIVNLVGCSFSKAGLDYHISSDFAYFFNTESYLNTDNYFHFSDTAVIHNGVVFPIEWIEEKQHGVYLVWTPTARYDLDLQHGEISSYSRRPKDGITKYITYENLKYYESKVSKAD